MTEYLEEDREKLIQRLQAAETPEKALPVLESEIDRLLLRSAEELQSDTAREHASEMLGAVRMALPLIDTTGEVKLWSREVGSAAGSALGNANRKSRLLLTAALILSAAALVLRIFSLLPAMIPGISSELIFWLIAAAAALCFYLSGRAGNSGRLPKNPDSGFYPETVIDAEKIYRTLRAATLLIDQNLRQQAAAESWAARAQEAPAKSDISSEDLTICADLLEGMYSSDPEYMLEKLGQLRYYLHSRNVEIVDYREELAGYFDCMPSSETKTLRPALMSDGKLLKKGLAGISYGQISGL